MQELSLEDCSQRFLKIYRISVLTVTDEFVFLNLNVVKGEI